MLVLALSVPMFNRAIPDACGSTIHEAWPAASVPSNAAGFTTAGP